MCVNIYIYAYIYIYKSKYVYKLKSTENDSMKHIQSELYDLHYIINYYMISMLGNDTYNIKQYGTMHILYTHDMIWYNQV